MSLKIIIIKESTNQFNLKKKKKGPVTWLISSVKLNKSQILKLEKIWFHTVIDNFLSERTILYVIYKIGVVWVIRVSGQIWNMCTNIWGNSFAFMILVDIINWLELLFRYRFTFCNHSCKGSETVTHPCFAGTVWL